MQTPIVDFVSRYQKSRPLRLHMPGHKGAAHLGPEGADITEIAGADELYHPAGIILESEENAASLFGAGKTLYSAEGSSLCIRAMAYLALLQGKAQGRGPVIWAGRNAHKTFLSACALLGAEVRWLYPAQNASLMACPLEPEALARALGEAEALPAAVYVTAPDYLGNRLDIRGLAAACHGRGVPLLVDNAHGAYLKFLETDAHPLTLGADMCCDSAHKTLPVLTGGAYLHLAPGAPAIFFENARRALGLFASTSPSYLILQSLDACNASLAGDYPQRLAAMARRLDALKSRLAARGFPMIGDEPLKTTLAPKAFGYTGDALHDALRRHRIECEFSDPDFLTMMFTPDTAPEEVNRLEGILLALPRREAVKTLPPPLPRPERALSLRDALFAPSREIPVEEAEGRIFVDAPVSCPPCVPIIAWGERIDRRAIQCFHYYGVEACRVADGVG